MALSDYELGEELGSGAFGVTTAATRRSDGMQVAVKELRLRGLPDWKPFERFEREAKTLRSMQHPGVVGFVDAFDETGDGEQIFYIVSERIEGRTLGEEIVAGKRWSEAEARALFERLLEALHYLHTLSPRVLHRDVKPSNIMFRDDGSPVLIDFGAVADLGATRADGGVTVMGTAGYMAPEQAMGKPDPRSDLYGLGATMVHILSHEHPSSLVDEDLRIDVPDTVGISAEFRALLERLLEPSLSDRCESAEAALEQLAAPESPTEESETRLAVQGSNLLARLPPAPRELSQAMLETLSAARNPRIAVQGVIVGTLGGIAVALISVLTKTPLLIGIAFLALGAVVAAVVFGARTRARALYASGVPKSGRVLSAQAQQNGQTIVRYAYEADGHTYEESFATRNALALQGVEVGSPVAVFHDKGNPQTSTALLPRELPDRDT